MASAADFDFSAAMSFDGSAAARANWDCLKAHMVAEWSGDLERTMATITRDNPFQIFHGTGTEIWGWDAVRAFYRERFTVFSGQGFYAKRIVCAADVIVAQGWCSITPREGRLFGADAAGKSIFQPLALWVYFERGLIKGEAAYFDGAEMRRQLRDGATGDVRTPLY
ncbi:MAG TPA: hypothetical protein VFA22_04830 [Stellaceae bacterium]|nr:hypothetical protein [Stellaceae bacterium]